MLRLLRLPDSGQGPSPYRIWLSACGLESEFREDYDLGDLIATLPQWATTSVFETRAALKVRSADKSALKAAYAEIFISAWERRKAELAKLYGIVDWKALASLGTREVEVSSDFAASGAGGLRIVFLSEDGEALAYLWMRGSGTEAVFRIQADVAGGDAEDEEYFLSWHSSMVHQADEAVMATP
jgi:phosphoglucomutase